MKDFQNIWICLKGTNLLNSNNKIGTDFPKDSPVRKMAEFMFTEAGQFCVEQARYGKLKN